MYTERLTNIDIEHDKFMATEKFLFNGKFKDLSNAAKLLYSILKDRLGLSIKNVREGKKYWLDKKGHVFIHATKLNIMELLNCCSSVAIKVKKELVKAGLIDDVRIGQGYPNRIYLLKVKFLERLGNTLKFTKRTTRSSDDEPLEVQKVNRNNTKQNKTKKNNTTTGAVDHLKDKFLNKIGETAPDKYIANLIKKYGKDNVEKVIDDFDLIRTDEINNIYGFFRNAVKAEAKGTPYTRAIAVKKQSKKPTQSTNFEQREYSDEFFDNLYDNYNEIVAKKEKEEEQIKEWKEEEDLSKHKPTEKGNEYLKQIQNLLKNK